MFTQTACKCVTMLMNALTLGFVFVSQGPSRYSRAHVRWATSAPRMFMLSICFHAPVLRYWIFERFLETPWKILEILAWKSVRTLRSDKIKEKKIYLSYPLLPSLSPGSPPRPSPRPPSPPSSSHPLYYIFLLGIRPQLFKERITRYPANKMYWNWNMLSTG